VAYRHNCRAVTWPGTPDCNLPDGPYAATEARFASARTIAPLVIDKSTRPSMVPLAIERKSATPASELNQYPEPGKHASSHDKRQ
jgi:hypothetical protein